MLRSVSEFQGYRIDASDGVIGKARDLFFDDAKWRVRYLVVDTGTWLPGRRVLISPVSLRSPDWQKRVFPIDLTKEQIENSPGVSTDEPISRQLEKDLVDYFNWPAYWPPAALALGPMGAGHPPAPVAPQVGRKGKGDTPADTEGDPHLRSTKEVCGYHVQAEDGGIGHVEDFIVDDEAWTIRYLVVDTRNWLPGRKVILACDWFLRFNWRESKAYTGLDKESIKAAPAYDPSQPINRDYEGRLYDYYGRLGYWAEAAAPSMTWKV